jgi:hypothetical protein
MFLVDVAGAIGSHLLQVKQVFTTKARGFGDPTQASVGLENQDSGLKLCSLLPLPSA